jgi:L-ascorbate metabolism protein UlaG (beta-lactamase superfamily)
MGTTYIMYKKATIVTTSFLLLSVVGFAQHPEPDKITTNSGELTIQPILHGTLMLDFAGKTVYVDPYGGANAFKGIKNPDLVLITDIHGDHLNAETLQSLDLSSATVMAPSAVGEQLSEGLKKNLKVIGNGQSTTWEGITITGVPMYNLPENADSRHTKGRGNGYLLEWGGKRIYISGDTEDIPEMRNLKNIDIAFVCMNMPYTMEVEQAAEAVLAFQPKIVYPYHYRGQGGLADVDKFKSLVNRKNTNIDVRLKNWYPAYE